MTGIVLDRSSSQPLSLQLTVALRKAVTGKSFSPGDRLPPSRHMAQNLGVSRNLVIAAYEQLAAEGYLSGRVGRGTYVTPEAGRVRRFPGPLDGGGDPGRSGGAPVEFDFMPGRPDLSAIPVDRWAECLRDEARRGSARDRGYGGTEGDERLRRAVSAWLFRIRGLEVSAEDILATVGTAQSLLLIALSVERGAFHCEDPCIPYAREAFASVSHRVVCLEADEFGALPPVGTSGSGVCYLNPSHQFPRGTRMPLERRLEFLEWADRTGSLIIEDDYDAEFRYEGLPISPMAGIAGPRVVYAGTFSKCLFPSLRIGYLIASGPLGRKLRARKRALMMRVPGDVQRALALFLERGYLDAHVRSMKKVYRERAGRIRAELDRRMGNRWRADGTEGGFHWSVRFEGARFGSEFFAACSGAGLALKGEGHYRMGEDLRTDRLVLGFGNIRDDRIEEGIELLCSLVGSAW